MGLKVYFSNSYFQYKIKNSRREFEFDGKIVKIVLTSLDKTNANNR